MTVYIVQREGRWHRSCAGVFTEFNKAIEVADKCKFLEEDGYHSYSVIPFELDKELEYKPSDEDTLAPYVEPEPLYHLKGTHRCGDTTS